MNIFTLALKVISSEIGVGYSVSWVTE